MRYESVKFETSNGIGRITLNRPDRLNSFTSAMHAEVRDALAAVKNDATLRVLLLTGAGRGFCAGQDLSDRAVAPGEGAVDLGESIDNNYRPLVLRLRALPLPVVCAVNGVAAGAGANIALACDLVIAAKSASFIQAFCKIGLIPDAGGTYFLPRLIGSARAMGSGIAQVAAQAGHPVQLFDTRIGAADAARERIVAALDALAVKGKIVPEAARAAAGRITAVHALADCVSAALVIEAIVED